ncbi:hypothetical protein [Sinosporangium album]|uniref:hypothetical protein n=1 Tax=Sinosporangium album TaxID=504805 RepID=UPI000B875D5D|nr:hypothetical protein [Sinosporangium album]
MTTARLIAIGLMLSVAGIPLGIVKGDGFDHFRLAALMGMLLGQFITLPLLLFVGIALGVPEQRSHLQVPGYTMGGVTLLFGTLIVTQAWATSAWLESLPPGVGDPAGEFAITMLAGLSGAVAVFLGLGMLVARVLVDRHLRLVNLPVPAHLTGDRPLSAILLAEEAAWPSRAGRV